MLYLLTTVLGCGFVDAPGDPLIESHRGGAAYWPQNSRTAMLGTIDAGYDAIEFDLVLTSDDVPVIAHDPWLSDPLCQNADGSDIVGRVMVHEVSWADLQSDYVCGGKVDPDFPDAEIGAESIMSFDELLDELEGSPDMLVHIDVKYEPGITPAADRYADAVMTRWVAADLPNDWYVSANTAEGTIAFEQWGRDQGVDVPTAIAWPTFPPDSSITMIGLGNVFGAAAGTVDMVQVIRAAQADGIAAAHRISDRRLVEETVANGYFVSLWTINDPDLLRTYSRYPVRSLITDIPGDAP